MSWFREEPRGTVVSLDSGREGLTFYIWFPYARDYVSQIREGDLVAVRSFASEAGSDVYCVLELASALPIHYALGTSSAEVERAFPGFVVEAAKSARQDWEQESPEEETTKIKTEAIATGIQLRFRGVSSPIIEPDQSLPMIGEEAHLLTDSLTNQVINMGLLDTSTPTIAPARLVLNPQVEVRMKVEDLLKTHFGVFGFTGAGKSNLISTLVFNLMSLADTGIKIVLFDLMSEYHPLLVDLLCELDTAQLLTLDMESLPGGSYTANYLRLGVESERAAQAIARTMLLPTELASFRGKFANCFSRVLQSGKLKVLDKSAEPPAIQEAVEILSGCMEGNIGTAKLPIQQWISNREAESGGHIGFDQLGRWADELDGYARQGQFPSGEITKALNGTDRPSGWVKMSPTAQAVVAGMANALRSMLPSEKERPPANARLSERQIVDMLCRDDGRPLLLIVQSDQDDALREFSARLVRRVFWKRRHEGLIQPLVLFMYDEADEFIPRERTEESYALSRSAAETLARRGRKFGMGLAIATQRVAYLDTKILGQAHTYLVSKLPRKYDRDTMAEAFGATEETLKRALRFTKGQWLLVSFDATGLQNVPIPIQFPNANERVKRYLETERMNDGLK
jgi:hypothetical protein